MTERLLTVLVSMGTTLLGHIIYRVYVAPRWRAFLREYLKEDRK